MAYPSSIDSFTPKNVDDTVLPPDVNDLQTAIVNIQNAVGTSAVYTFLEKTGGTLTGDLNIASSQEIQHNGTAAIGYLTDGTPVYGKWLSGVISNGTTFTTITHGVANARSSNLIMGITIHIDEGSTFIGQVSIDSHDNIPWYSTYSNTSIQVNRGGSTGTKAALVFILFKD